MAQFAFAFASSFVVWCHPVLVHPGHSRADSVEEAAMAAVVQDCHNRIVQQDSSVYLLFAPAYVQAEMDGHSDPRRWRYDQGRNVRYPQTVARRSVPNADVIAGE